MCHSSIHPDLNGLTAGHDTIRFYIFFYQHIKYQLLNMLNIKRDINQHDFKIIDLRLGGFMTPFCT